MGSMRGSGFTGNSFKVLTSRKRRLLFYQAKVVVFLSCYGCISSFGFASSGNMIDTGIQYLYITSHLKLRLDLLSLYLTQTGLSHCVQYR